jgi:hypothetical protein
MRANKASFIVVAGLSLMGVGYGIRAFGSGIPSTNALSYSGVLEDGSGPVTGPHNIQLFLYDAATAGNILCQTTTAAIGVIDGHFSVPLPDTCTKELGLIADTWIDVLVDGSDTGRTKIGAVPYAIEANHAVNASTATAAQTGGALQTTLTQIEANITSLQGAPAPLTTVFGSTVSAADDTPYGLGGHGSACIASPNLVDCEVAANRKCSNLGYKAGWFVGESSDGITRTIVCIK